MTTDINIDFYVTPFTGMDGVRRTTTLGLGSNRTLWIEWKELGLGPHHSQMMVEKFPGAIFLIDEENERLFVNADAVTAIIDRPDFRAAWVSNKEFLLKNYECIRRYESSRNN